MENQIEFEYVWDSRSIGYAPHSSANLENYVVEVHWRYRATLPNENANQVISKDQYGVKTFDIIEDNPDYIPFEELTYEIIIGWLNLDEDAMQLALTKEIENILNPPIIYSNLPN